MTIKLSVLEPKRRDLILNAALKEFIAKGYDQASTNVIAKNAGISKALMFHYVTNKQELFLYMYDFFTELLDKEYYMQMNNASSDLFERLRQSYLLQIDLLQRYSDLIDFNKLKLTTNHEELNAKLKKRIYKKTNIGCDELYDSIDESKFRDNVTIEVCKQMIQWINEGYIKHLLADIDNHDTKEQSYESMIGKVNVYLDELKKIFYVSV